MGTHPVNPTGYARTLAVIRPASRIRAAVGNWQKHGAEADRLLAEALVVPLGTDALRIFTHQQFTGEPMSLRRSHQHTPPPLDRTTVEFMAKIFAPTCPDPDDSEREIWMKAGETRAALHMMNLSEKQERNFRV